MKMKIKLKMIIGWFLLWQILSILFCSIGLLKGIDFFNSYMAGNISTGIIFIVVLLVVCIHKYLIED